MKKIMSFNRAITAPLVCLMLNSCQWISTANGSFSAFTSIKIPDGTAIFQKGFRDGCGNAFYARGNGLFRARYTFRFEGKLAGNSEYRFGLSRGYGYCFAYALSGVAGGPHASSDRMLSPHGYDSTFGAANQNAAWGDFFGGTAFSNVGFGGSVDGVFGVYQTGIDGKTSAFNANGVLWAGGSSGQFFGQP